MAINTSALNSTLQSRVDALDAATDTKEVLLLSKALDAAAGSTSVSDVLSEGVVQVNNVNSEGSAQVANVQNEGATQRASVGAVLGDYTLTTGFKTVGGTSIVGSGDIATLPSGGSAGQVLLKDGGNAPAWDTLVTLPSQTSNAQNVLTTDGTNASWLDNHEATQLFGTVLSSNVSPISSVTDYANVTITLSETMNNFRGLIFVGSNWSNMWYYPVSVLNNTVKMPSDSASGLANGAMHMLASYDAYHFYIRRVSDTQVYVQSGSGNGLQQIFGVK